MSLPDDPAGSLAITNDATATSARETGLLRELTLLDSTMIVAGSMIGSGIFIVPAEIARQVGSAGLLIAVWIVTGLLTVAAALAYGELASMMPQAGGQYVYLREAYSPLWGFLYGWTLFLVIQTGTIAAVAVAFARYLGVMIPWIAPDNWIVAPIDLSGRYAVSLSTQQLVAIAMLAGLTWSNTRGVRVGKIIQNTFTSVKTLSLLALIVLGIFIGRNSGAIAANFGARFWPPRNVVTIQPELPALPPLDATSGVAGLLVAFCIAQVGSLFSADAWNNITFTAAEVKEPRRNVPLSLVLGAGGVIVLYVLANLAYLCVLPIEQIQNAPDDRVGTAALQQMFGPGAAVIMAAAIVISTFGCNNGLILAGARVYYAMARDRLFFEPAGRLNRRHVPATGLVLQCLWASLLVLPRTRMPDGRYGNLYSNLLNYVVAAVLLFYILTIAGVFVLRRKRPDAERPYRALGYPIVPAAYIAAASVILVVLLLYLTSTTWPGLLIVLTGIPVYFLWRRKDR
ncbi:MAG TPA: amino acid permease [Thermoanaerobaculia bacterium]|nr:amino acid permease [Thermoanaerobaculia bacterium]